MLRLNISFIGSIKLNRSTFKMCGRMMKSRMYDLMTLNNKFIFRYPLHSLHFVNSYSTVSNQKQVKRVLPNAVNKSFVLLSKRKAVALCVKSYKYSTSVTPSPNISLTHVKRVLLMKNMEVKDGFTCLTTRCVSCTHANRSGGDLFIIKVTGYFVCSKCKASGSWDTLERALKKGEPYLPSDEIVEAPAKWTSVCEKCENLQLLPNNKILDVLKLFRFEGSFQDKLMELEPLVNQSGTHMYIPIKSGGHIVGVKELTPGGRETTVPNVGCKGLLIITSNRKMQQQKEAVIVHSVRDMLSLGTLKLPCDVISLPHGILNLPQEVLPLLEDYRKITLWFGNEDGHWESARHFAKKLNEKRCYFVRPTEDHPSPNKAHQEGRDLWAIVQSAMPIAHKAITHFTNLREDILSHLQNVDKAAGVKWARFPALNTILKGHRRGEMTILTGPSGAGKTTLMSEYSLDLAMQGVTTLWGSFEIRNERLARTMLQQLCKFPIHLQLDQFNKWADIFQLMPIYFMTFHGQQPLKPVMEAVEHAAYVHDISHVIIDNVQFMMGQSEGDNSLDRFYRQDSIIGAFRNFATVANCHVTLVIHPRKEKDAELLSMNSVFGGAKATQEADNVLIIQQKTLQNLKIKKFLQIAKNRYSGDLGVMPLDFDKESLSFAQKQPKKDIFVKETTEMSR